MKKLSKLHLRYFLVLVLATLAHAQDENLAGHWIGTISKGDRSGAVALDLITSAGKIGGTLSDPSGQVMKIQNFRVEGNHLTFDASGKEHGRPEELHFVGEVANAEIRIHRDMGSKSGPTIVLRRQGQ